MDTIFEIDDIDKPVEEKQEKPKREPKIRKKKEMSEERRQKLLENLSRGRKTLAEKRAKAKGEKPKEEKKVIKKEEKAEDSNIRNIKPTSNNEDLRNEISELKKLILENRRSEKSSQQQEKKENPKVKQEEKPKEIKSEVQATTRPPTPISNTAPVSAPIPVPKKKKRSVLGGGMVLNLDRFKR